MRAAIDPRPGGGRGPDVRAPAGRSARTWRCARRSSDDRVGALALVGLGAGPGGPRSALPDLPDAGDAVRDRRPILFVAGDADAFCPATDVRELAGWIPGARGRRRPGRRPLLLEARARGGALVADVRRRRPCGPGRDRLAERSGPASSRRRRVAGTTTTAAGRRCGRRRGRGGRRRRGRRRRRRRGRGRRRRRGRRRGRGRRLGRRKRSAAGQDGRRVGRRGRSLDGQVGLVAGSSPRSGQPHQEDAQEHGHRNSERAGPASGSSPRWRARSARAPPRGASMAVPVPAAKASVTGSSPVDHGRRQQRHAGRRRWRRGRRPYRRPSRTGSRAASPWRVR